MQGGWWGPWPRTAPHQQRALVPHAALWVLEPQPSVPASCRPLSLPSLLVLLPQACHPPGTPQAHSHVKPRQQHHLLCPQPGCRGQEMARHTPPSPLGPTLAAPPCQACHPPLCLLWRQHAGARCLPTPLPRAPAELGIQEQGLCPGLTGCPPWEEHVQPGLKRAPQAGVTTGGSCGTPLPSGQGSDLWGSGGSSGFIPGFLTLLRFQAHHRHILGRALPKLKGHVVSTAVAPPRGAVPWPLQGLGFLQASLAFSWGRPGVSSG